MRKLTLVTVMLILSISCGKGFDKDKPGVERQDEGQQEDEQVTLPSLYMELVNDHRALMGLKALVYEPIIEEIALTHSKAMGLRTRPFGHTGFSYRCRRIRSRLEDGNLCGEVVAYGQQSPMDVYRAWMNSPGHRKKLEDPRYTHTGLGVYEDKDGRIYWTQMFIEL